MSRNTVHRVASVTAGILLLAGITLFTACFFTTWNAKWVLGVLMVWGFIGLTAWTDRPELTR
jgi:Ca2+/Na+ antiporter